MATKGRVLQTVIALTGKVDPALGKAMQDVQKQLDGVNVKAVAIGTAIGAAIGTGVMQGTKYLAELGDSYNTAMNDIQKRTGATAAEMEQFGDVMQDIYKAGYGESFAEVASGISEVRTMTKLAGDELADVTKGAFALQETFDYGINETARAAKALMTNFGESGADAMNLIAAGAQNGLDYSGEMLDSISEYSVQFGKLGFTAEDMFKIFQAGADSGAWNLDKVGDAIKEFSIRSIDGSKTSAAAYEALGYDADEMFQTFTKGGDEATGAFHEVLNRLMDMEDHVARDAAGVGLFGTMWEDLGVDAMQALADMQAGAYAAGDELAGIQELRYDSIGEAFQVIKRELEVGLLPAATTVANFIVEKTPEVTAAIEKAANFVGVLRENADVLIPVIAGVSTALGLYKLASMASAVATGGATGAITLQTVAAGAWTTVSGIAATATTALGTAFRFMTGPVGLIITAIGLAVAAGIALYKNWDTVKETLGRIIDGIKEKFSAGFTALVGIVKAPVNTIIGMINGVIDKINSAGFVVPDWVPVIGGKGFSVNIPKIPMLAAGGFTNGVSIAGEAGTEAVISFDPAHRSENLNYWAQAGRMLGAETSDYNLGGGGSVTAIDLGGVQFAPEIIVNGDARKEDIIQALREAYPEFIDLLESWLFERGEFAYG